MTEALFGLAVKEGSCVSISFLADRAYVGPLYGAVYAGDIGKGVYI
jgi:hypothetical protein